MGYANIQADSNFYRQSLNADGVKYVTGPYTSLYEDVFRAVTVTTDSVVSVTSYVGDSLSNQFLLAGTEIYGLFSSVTIHSGKAVLHLAGASYISEIINQYSASGIPLGFYEEGTQCLSQKISALLTQGVFDDASWVMVPSQYKEDTVRAFKPTSELGNLAFTRASDATYTDSTGVVRRSPYNLLQQSETFNNAVWISDGTTTVTANAYTAPNGTLTADRLQMSISQRRYIYQTITPTQTTYTYSVYLRANSNQTVRISVDQGCANYRGGLICNVTTEWQRFSITLSNIVISSGVVAVVIDNITSNTNACTGTAVGVDIFAWGAQLVEGTDAKPYFATTNRQDVPRLDYRNADGSVSTCPRLLLEPQRTNSIRNSSMVGAVAGTPGTFPTNWGFANSAGLTRSVVGVGTENGLPYIDVRIDGTASGSGINLYTDLNISASSSQVWSNSAYIKIITQPSPPLLYRLQTVYVNSGAYVTESVTAYTPTTTLSRFTATHTAPASTITNLYQAFSFTLTNGATYDFTIRIAAPQMELGAYATTWVPTTTAAVTRLADTASKTGVSSLIGQNSGTLFVEWDNSDKGLINLLETYNNASGLTGTSTILIQKSLANQLNIRVFDSLGNYSDNFTATMPNGTNKLALAYQPGSAVYYLNGTFVGGNTRTYVFGSTRDAVGLDSRAQYPRAQAALFPTRLDNTTLAALTTL